MNTLILLAAFTIVCPQTIEVKQTIRAVEGWEQVDPKTPHKYYFAQFSDGSPSQEAFLMHDIETSAGKDKVLQYRFLESQEPWLICSYTGTSAILARKLPKASKSCQLTLDHAHNFETVSAISCN